VKSQRPDGLDDHALEERLELAIASAHEAAHLVMPYFRSRDFAVDTKSDSSPVTIADRNAETLLRDAIEKAYPDDGILGEEHGEKVASGTGGFRWILDPIDGTESFVRGVPLFGTLIGIEFGGVSVGGVINLPALGEMLYASRDHGTWHVVGEAPPTRAHVSSTADVASSLAATAGGDGFRFVDAVDAQSRLTTAFGKSRGWGDCYGYYLVATGKVDLMVDPIMSIWDNAPMLPVIEEAGGRFTDWDGVPTIHSSNGVASNGLIHDAALKILRGQDAN